MRRYNLITSAKKRACASTGIRILLGVIGVAVVVGFIWRQNKSGQIASNSNVEQNPMASAQDSSPIDIALNGAVTASAARKPVVDYKTQFIDVSQIVTKAIPTRAEKSKLERELSSPKMLEYTSNLLLDTDSKAQTDDAETLRMQAIGIFATALDWKENPLREEWLRKMNVILSRSIHNLPVGVTFKRSVAGDAMELYEVMLLREPARARDLLDQVEPEQRRLFDYVIRVSERSNKKS